MKTTGEDGEYEEQLPKFHGLYLGEVVKRDPVLKRVRVRIPNLLDPTSPWAYSMGAGGGGSVSVGMLGLPRIGASVYVMFLNGDPEEPRFMPGHWAKDEIPEEVKEKTDAAIWSSESFYILIDEGKEDEEPKVQIRSRKTDEFLIELNNRDNTILIQAPTGIVMESIGAITLDAAQVIINGRKVLPNADPI